MRKAISVLLVLAFMIGVMPSFSTPAQAYSFNFASSFQVAVNAIFGCVFDCGFGFQLVGADQSILQVSNIYQR